MRGYMFKSRWGALLFVCLTAFGAANLIGGEDDPGVLLDAADELTQTRDEFGNPKLESSQPAAHPLLNAGIAGQSSSSENFVSGFVPDDKLIDDARGFYPEPDVNPTPELDRADQEGDVVMYIEAD